MYNVYIIYKNSDSTHFFFCSSETKKMVNDWMGNNNSELNASELGIREIIDHPSSVRLFEDYPSWLLYFAAGCCILFMVIGIPGNLITIAALFRTKKVCV